MNTVKSIAVIFALAVIAASCGTKQSKSTGQVVATSQGAPQVTMTGSDRDEHGCIRSAGYTWSVVRNDCIRPWETGIRLASTAPTTDTSAAYLVFAKDSTRAELFMAKLPSGGSSIVLNRAGTRQVWGESEQPGAVAAVNTGDGWAITSMDKTLFREVK